MLLLIFNSITLFFLLLMYGSTVTGIYLSIVSDINAFVLFSPQHGTNNSRKSIFLQDGCPSSSSYIVGTESGRRHVLSLDSIKKIECAVMIKIASNIISLERPFVDLIAVADVGVLSYVRQPLCITAQLVLSTSVTAPISCTISPFDSTRQTCLLRSIVPYSWYLSAIDSKQTVTLLYTIDRDCGTPNAELYRTKLTLFPLLSTYKSFDIDKQIPIMHLQIMSPTNFTFVTNSFATLLVHLNYNGSNDMQLTAIQIRIWFSSRFKLLSVTSANPKLWTVQVESAADSDSYTTLLCQYSQSNLQRSNGYIVMMLIKVKSSTGNFEAQSNTDKGGNLVNTHWTVQYVLAGNSTYLSESITKQVTIQFRIINGAVYAILPMVKGKNLINTAVLSGKQTSVPMRIFSITESGNVKDVTSNSYCLSTESRVLKVSPTCSSLYVDGSELRGMGNVKVHVHFETLSTSIEITVWYPRLPLTVWISDPVLNAIKDWQIAVWKWLSDSRRKKKREARQFGCINRYQQAEVRILASYYVGDKETGERIYLSGDRDLLFDVTSLAMNHVHSSNVAVAAILPRHDRVFVIAHRPGSTRITIRSNTPSIDYGSTPVVVSEDLVSIRRLAVEGIVDISLDIEANPERLHEYFVSTFTHTTLTYKYQHAVVACRIYFSDEQILELTDIPSDQYILKAWSSDEHALVVNQGANQDIELIVLQNIKNVLLSVSLYSPSQCSEPDSKAIMQIDYPVQIEFNERKHSTSMPSIIASYNKSVTSWQSETASGSWHSEILLGLIILLAVVVGLIHTIGSRARRPFNQGYEKLVLPLLTRLSSSTSCGKDENSQEWVWLSKAQIDSASINSRVVSTVRLSNLAAWHHRKTAFHLLQDNGVVIWKSLQKYSQKSTMDVAENVSNLSIGSTQRSISYRGSEISVFISPQPAVAINLDSLGRRTTSWRGRPITNLTRSTLIDSSSSEHNLSRYSYTNSNGYSFSPPSAGYEKSSWCEGDSVTPTQEMCWRRNGHNMSHDSMPDNDGIRETAT